MIIHYLNNKSIIFRGLYSFFSGFIGFSILCIVAGLNLIYPPVSIAQLSPGDLHRSHAHLEGLKNCSTCHGIGQGIKAIQCLECHQILKEKISQNKGLHSRSEYQECQKCHVEHQGRDFDLIYWKNGQENFDHQQTGFLLEDKHTQIKCRECHQEKYIAEKTKYSNQGKDLNRTFFGLTQKCLNCHRDNHRGQLSSTCLNCHLMEGWKPAPGFNHNETKFALTGKHQRVQCAGCHRKLTDNKYEENKTYLKYSGLQYQACTNCHQDTHQNKFGQNCTKCHNTSGWANYNSNQFDHTLTEFPLKGKHQIVTCEKCHSPGRALSGLKFDLCTDCHQDHHQGQFTKRLQGGACEACHTVDGFIPSTFTIESHNKTKFSLQGAHLAIPCIACHRKISDHSTATTIQFTFSSTTCNNCHKNPHGQSIDKFFQSNKCESCHNVDSWRAVQFDHNQTNFSLEFKHDEIPCKSCHFAGKEHLNQHDYEFTKLSRDCQDCHKDPHNDQFKEANAVGKKMVRCERCHTPRNWKGEKFNHDLQSSFKLEGAHENLSCNRCHPTEIQSDIKFVRYKGIPNKCIDCHGKKLKSENDRDA